jgi:hypothetical protein
MMAGFWLLRAALQPVFWTALPRTTNLLFSLLFLTGAGLHLLALLPA